jgi:NDP-sugar pyrophosphorylase family protein
MKTLHVSVGGEGSRIRQFMNGVGFADDFPKHLLSVDGKQLVERIIDDARIFDRIILHASNKNARYFMPIVQRYQHVDIAIDRHMNGHLAPLVRAMQRSGQTSYGCDGDILIDGMDWAAFINFHEQHALPYTLYAARSSVYTNDSALRVNEQGVVTERSFTHHEHDALYSVGVYCIDPHPAVDAAIAAMNHEMSSQALCAALIPQLLVNAYVAKQRAYNINTETVYQDTAKPHDFKAATDSLLADSSDVG